MALPSEVNALLLGSGTEYQISRSLRFRSGASPNLSRTPAVAGSRTTYTFSYWFKRGTLSVNQTHFAVGTDGQNYFFLGFGFINNNDQLDMVWASGNVVTARRQTNRVFRDPSAWYHVVAVLDTNNATATSRVNLYINGVQETSFSASVDPTQGTNQHGWNTAVANYIGAALPTYAMHNDGYMAEVNFIDGQALTPSSFGYTDPKTGVWMPKAYLGTYGTNGFYLKFTDNSAATATAIGRDFSGNGNNWTPVNISVTPGVNDDSMIDTPTNYADGGNGRGNYAVWNPLLLQPTMSITNGNLTSQNTGTAARTTVATIGVNSGKWYWELTILGVTVLYAGITTLPPPAAGEYIGFTSTSWAYANNGQKINAASFTAYGATFTTNDVIGVALDMDAGTITFFKNGVSQGQAFSGITGTIFPAMSPNGVAGNGFHANFGQRTFAYTPPAGFRALNTQNFPTTNIQNGALAFDAALYTGTGAARSITGELFTPDLVWIKSRSATTDHAWYDAVRGPQLQLESNNNAAETNETTGLTAFNSGGFDIGSLAQINTNAASYVAWAWDAGSSTVTNTAGTLTAGVRANPAAGVSIVTWTHNGSTGTIGHGLGVAPRMIIAKTRNGANDWMVYAAPIGATAGLFLNLSNAQTTSSVIWNNTAPTSTVFSAGSTFSTNACVAYCFANVPGFSIIGSYIGNGSTDGPFVFCGFRPRWVMIKLASGIADWVMLDTAMNPFNVASLELYPNLNLAENAIAGPDLDFLSNGFKLRNTAAGQNTSGGTHIFAAFAENPFKIARAR